MADIDIRVTGRAGRITLTRPQALNAMSYDMCMAIDAALSEDGVKRMFDMAATADNVPFPTFQGDELPEIERRGFGEFVVNQENGEPGLVFHRVGLGWKLAGIEVPDEPEEPAPAQ